MKVSIGQDTYERTARLKVALLTVLPGAWSILAVSPADVLGWSGFWSLFVGAGGTYLLSHLARDYGKALEKRLFLRWGGRPTEVVLSHAGRANPVTLRTRHAKLQQLFPQLVMPTPEDEAKDQIAARVVYRACVEHLVGRTRDTKRYQLLFQENCSYGFRRNLVGLKPFGLVISSGAVAMLGLHLYGEASMHRAVSSLAVTAEVLNVAFLFAWLLWFRHDWVKLTADAYAERLSEAIDSLS